MEEVVSLITTNGMGVVLMAYFIYKDWKFNEQIVKVLGEVKEVLTSLKTVHDIE